MIIGLYFCFCEFKIPPLLLGMLSPKTPQFLQKFCRRNCFSLIIVPSFREMPLLCGRIG
jgi:hypothetical protein